MSSTYLNEEARGYIEGIRNTKRKMEAEFETFNAEMQKLSAGDACLGSAGSAYFEKYNSLKQEYQSFSDLFDSFANDYEHAVEATEQTNKQVEQAASEIPGV